jgi:hypothetical protein
MARLAAAALFLAAMATAQITYPDTTIPLSVNPTSYLSSEYGYNGSPIPTHLSGAALTSIASELYSVELSFVTDPNGAASVNRAIWSAAAKATDASRITASFEASGWDYVKIATEDWYKRNMPAAAKSEASEFLSLRNSVFDKADALATKTTQSGNHGAAGAVPACTGMAIAAAGVVAGVAAMM